MDKNKKITTNVIITERKLCLKDTIIALIPFTYSIIVYISIFILGMLGVYSNINDENFKAIYVIIWLMIMMNLSKIVVVPKTVWEVRTIEE